MTRDSKGGGIGRTEPGSCDNAPFICNDIDKRYFTRYTTSMILSFRHKGLQRFYEHQDERRIPTELAPRLRRILAAVDTAQRTSELGLFPGWRVHRLRGEFKGYWSVSVSGNWRVVFRFKDGDAFDVDLVDYH